MSSKADFERALLALDQEKLRTLLENTVQMYIELVNVHGYGVNSGRYSAARETLDGLRATVELDDAGEL